MLCVCICVCVVQSDDHSNGELQVSGDSGDRPSGCAPSSRPHGSDRMGEGGQGRTSAAREPSHVGSFAQIIPWEASQAVRRQARSGLLVPREAAVC